MHQYTVQCRFSVIKPDSAVARGTHAFNWPGFCWEMSSKSGCLTLAVTSTRKVVITFALLNQIRWKANCPCIWPAAFTNKYQEKHCSKCWPYLDTQRGFCKSPQTFYIFFVIENCYMMLMNNCYMMVYSNTKL